MAKERPRIIPVSKDNTGEAVRAAAEALAQGLLVVMPTDTVYGVAADPRVPGAEERLASAKGRPEDKPIPLLAAGLDVVEQYGAELTAAERRLAERFWPGPLTLVLRVKTPAGPGREGFRVPDCDVALALLRAVGGVLRVTSANRSGEPPALRAADAVSALEPAITLVLDGGPTPGGVASSVVRLDGDQLQLIREGAIPESELRRALQ